MKDPADEEGKFLRMWGIHAVLLLNGDKFGIRVYFRNRKKVGKKSCSKTVLQLDMIEFMGSSLHRSIEKVRDLTRARSQKIN